MREKLRGGLGYPGVTTSELKVRDAKRGKRRDGGRGVVKHGKGKMMDFQSEPAESYVGFLRQNQWMQEVVDAPTFSPTMEEFADPIKYIRSIEPMARKYGICKIQPPKELRNEVHLFSDGRKKDFHFTVRSQKMKEHHWENFDEVDVLFDVAGSCTVDEFRKHANDLSQDHIGGTARMPPNFVEAEYWRQRSMPNGKPFYVEYGNDVEGSAFLKSDVPSVAGTRWNLQVFGKDNGSVLRHLSGELPGITSPMLYIGAVFATFFWHVEDHFMHSINYMHCGAPKTWYGVPGECATEFEQVCIEKVYKDALHGLRKAGHSEEEVKALGLRNLMKKTTMFSPKHLVESGVPVYRTVQKTGEFVVTFPRSYHGGFSHGFNIGEAVNFGLKEWFQQGESAVKRYCWLRMQQILPHEELLVREAVQTESKYRTGKGPIAEEDQVLLKQFLFFMNEQRLMRGVLVDRGMPVFPAFAVQQSQTCYTCGRKSFLAHIVTTASQECHCLNCVCKEGVVGKDAKMYVNPVLPHLESIEGVLRPFVQRETVLAGTSDQRSQELCMKDPRYPGSCSAASPTSTSTNVNPTPDPLYASGSGFSLHVGCESELCIEGKKYLRRVLMSNWGGKTRRLILLEEMLRAMEAPVDEPEDVQHVLGAFCEAIRQEPHSVECFPSGPPQRTQFINSQSDCEDGIVLGEDDARGILATLEGEVREKMAKFVKGLWEGM